jgi:hypothetical protein
MRHVPHFCELSTWCRYAKVKNVRWCASTSRATSNAIFIVGSPGLINIAAASTPFRKRLVVTSRMVRISQTLAGQFMGQQDKALIRAISTPDMPLRSFLFFTAYAPITSLLSSFTGYIDFAYQVPLIMATISIHVYGGVPVVNCAFMTNPSQALPLLTSACDWVAQLPRLLFLELHPLEHAIDQKLCTSHGSGVVYMLFMHVFLSAMLPLVFTFRMERRMKLQWLRLSGHSQSHPAERTPATFVFAGFLVIFLVSLAISWLLSLLPLYECQQ